MALYINGVPLASGVKHYFNGTQIKNIYYRHGGSSGYTLVYQYDNVAPTINITSGSGYVPSLSYTLSGTISDTESGVASAYYLQGSSSTHRPLTLVATSTSGTYSFSANLSLSSGTTQITVVATDNAGNTRTQSISLTYDASAHAASLTTTLITRTDYSTDYGWDYSHRSNASKDIQDFYVSQYASSQCSGSGLTVWASANYAGRINISTLPNWQSIRRIVITRYGYGTQTFNLNGSSSYVAFSDSSSASTSAHSTGDYASVSAKAGISSLTYYYA